MRDFRLVLVKTTGWFESKLQTGLSQNHDTAYLTLEVPESKLAEFTNSADLDEVAHFEPSNLDQHYLACSL